MKLCARKIKVLLKHKQYRPHKLSCDLTKVKLIRHVPSSTILALTIHYLVLAYSLICEVHLSG